MKCWFSIGWQSVNQSINQTRISLICCNLGQVARTLVNANPGLKVNRRIHFSSIHFFFSAFVLCSLKLFKLKTEGQTIQR